MKKILITGANSYIGTSFEKYMAQFGDEYQIDTVDMIGDAWKEKDFSGYDTVFHVAGIAHQKETLENAHLYYEVNRNLAVATAKKAKRKGVKQFILLSSMSVYGMDSGVITKETVPHPKSHYGKSKLQADEKIVKYDCDTFKVAILRPPMVYGKGCKGNYQRLRKFALMSPIFLDYPNERSMIFIDNLCEFVKELIDERKNGLFFPQNAEYVNTSCMVAQIAEKHKRSIYLTNTYNMGIKCVPLGIIKKVFGNLVYEKTDLIDKYNFEDSIRLSETNVTESDLNLKKKKALCIASMASNLDNFNRNNVKILQALGYEVTLASNFHSSEDTNSKDKIDRFILEMKDENVNIVHVDFSRKIANIKGQVQSYKQVKNLLSQRFDLIHCHSPICAAITRICAHKYQKTGRTKVLYTAHGFHFYDGAPTKNWILFYPIEKLLSKYTDVLITINSEDYNRAMNSFYAKTTIQIPGVGIDLSKYKMSEQERERAKIQIRKEIGIPLDSIIITSVGELNENKNQSVIIKALGKAKLDNVHYLIVGCGSKEKALKQLAIDLGLEQQVHLVGYRTDVNVIYNASDICAFTSIREGLGLAWIEGMASGLPLIISNNRGTREYVCSNNGYMFKFNDIHGFSNAIKKLALDKSDRIKKGSQNQTDCLQFSSDNINKIMLDVYKMK